MTNIERSIKAKIEAVGTPLRDWEISINYGIKTGFNDAFIIDSAKREQILTNCKTNEERERTAAIIRPILRGRDIKRYDYSWDEKYIIATFPSMQYNIEDYQAIKSYLLSFGMERLEQTGKEYFINGEKVKARKKTKNKWFETQDSISYWDDFLKPKIIWKRVGSILRFSYDNQGFFGLDSTCFATGNEIAFICCLLNSSMGHYLLNGAPRTGTGDLLISVQAVEPIKIPPISPTINNTCKVLIDKAIRNLDTSVEDEIDDLIFSLYGLTDEEKKYLIANFRV